MLKVKETVFRVGREELRTPMLLVSVAALLPEEDSLEACNAWIKEAFPGD